MEVEEAESFGTKQMICDRLVSNPEDIPNRLEVDIQFYINHQSIFSTAYVTSCAKCI
ncbi:BnaCnng04440D [Brassica napus]|uniref:BnaCnng04440D protein n=1 Tax=Brassica napus TaxID=3708 RepID=A0A078FPP0_BRANA|nr:BnaCnng04440D [Brassica napus]